MALATAVVVHYSRRETPTAQKQAEVLIALSTEQGFAYFLALGMMWRGAALATQGQIEEGMAQLASGNDCLSDHRS